MDLTKMGKTSGRYLREDGSYLNIVDSVTTVHHNMSSTPCTGEIGEINGLRHVAVSSYGTASGASLAIQVSIDKIHWYHKCVFYHYNSSYSDGESIDGIVTAGWKYIRVLLESVENDGWVSIVSNAIY